jgi:hypothetical protein
MLADRLRLPDPPPAERRLREGGGLTSPLAVGAGQLRLDRQMDVAVDVIDPDAVDDPVGLQDREDLRLHPS